MDQASDAGKLLAPSIGRDALAQASVPRSLEQVKVFAEQQEPA
jgi:hypothetical protein